MQKAVRLLAFELLHGSYLVLQDLHHAAVPHAEFLFASVQANERAAQTSRSSYLVFQHFVSEEGFSHTRLLQFDPIYFIAFPGRTESFRLFLSRWYISCGSRCSQNAGGRLMAERQEFCTSGAGQSKSFQCFQIACVFMNFYQPLL